MPTICSSVNLLLRMSCLPMILIVPVGSHIRWPSLGGARQVTPLNRKEETALLVSELRSGSGLAWRWAAPG
jgi:hypothetical protein